ncbi:methylated-DNA--[protein]-cysteine S-methyltransferase [Litchfieldia salsa]|uniref:methylated-DNA--[protein]-cysteine S-methyltransferase n=1 Tax=Litchfieldia salsa TaxID=930152 RepID=A0A1H0VX63_9BACI|nr:methylated-DNA--[protein]-cysteine S-methyltransferase [Litchfieldia salsa]SDP83004.1 methylated-DNA-[protein]-cysteine S-methyltransferase [Litchfieldia salsa]
MEHNKDHSIYWSLVEYLDWKIHIAATSKGLCYVGSHEGLYKDLEAWTKKRFSSYSLQYNDELLQPFVWEVIEYLKGSRKSFTIPLDMNGTPFQLQVWDALTKIPYGHTASYTDIANTIQKPKAVRAVGTAIGANPLLISVPCHRVIGKDGSLAGYRGGLDMKKRLLQIEETS